MLFRRCDLYLCFIAAKVARVRGERWPGVGSQPTPGREEKNVGKSGVESRPCGDNNNHTKGDTDNETKRVQNYLKQGSECRAQKKTTLIIKAEIHQHCEEEKPEQLKKKSLKKTGGVRVKRETDRADDLHNVLQVKKKPRKAANFEGGAMVEEEPDELGESYGQNQTMKKLQGSVRFKKEPDSEREPLQTKEKKASKLGVRVMQLTKPRDAQVRVRVKEEPMGYEGQIKQEVKEEPESELEEYPDELSDLDMLLLAAMKTEVKAEVKAERAPTPPPEFFALEPGPQPENGGFSQQSLDRGRELQLVLQHVAARAEQERASAERRVRRLVEGRPEPRYRVRAASAGGDVQLLESDTETEAAAAPEAASQVKPTRDVDRPAQDDFGHSISNKDTERDSTFKVLEEKSTDDILPSKEDIVEMSKEEVSTEVQSASEKCEGKKQTEGDRDYFILLGQEYKEKAAQKVHTGQTSGREILAATLGVSEKSMGDEQPVRDCNFNFLEQESTEKTAQKVHTGQTSATSGREILAATLGVSEKSMGDTELERDCNANLVGQENTDAAYAVQNDMPSCDEQQTCANVKRYGLRQLPRKDYCEGDPPDDDEFIFCDQCGREWEGDCPNHGPLEHIGDTEVEPDCGPERAARTVPAQLAVATSSIPGAGQGVWTRQLLPQGLRFGPYQGIRTTRSTSAGYSWQIKVRGRTTRYVDAADPSRSNWMRFVNCARNAAEQTVVAHQYRGEVYYRTPRALAAHTELLVWYGNGFARELGICPERFHAPLAAPLPRVQFPCPGCGGRFDSPLALQEHRCPPPPPAPAPPQPAGAFPPQYKCEICGRRYRLAQQLRAHLGMHAGERRHVCAACGVAFDRGSRLRAHQRTHTGDRPHGCPVCGKRFGQAGHLRQHQRVHTGEKPYSCPDCPARFAQRGHLQGHQRTHTGEKPYSCPDCPARFSERSSLQGHQRVHTGERPYSCPDCPLTFTRSGSLRSHRLYVHSDLRPHRCGLCPAAFLTGAHLRQHQLSVHERLRPFACAHCSHCCSRKSNLRRHLQRVHGLGDGPRR